MVSAPLAPGEIDEVKMSIGIIPLYDRIVVKRDEPVGKTPGGIHLVQTAQEKPKKGTVVAVGDGQYLNDGSIRPLILKPGDRVLFGRYAGSEIEIDGEDYSIMREGDVSCILQNEDVDIDAGTSTGRRDAVSSFYQG